MLRRIEGRNRTVLCEWFHRAVYFLPRRASIRFLDPYARWNGAHCREVKEAWIRDKYEAKRFLPSLRVDATVGAQLVGAVIARDVAEVSLLLARASAEDVNTTVSGTRDRRSPLHLACSIGSLAILQLLLWVSGRFAPL